MRKPWDVIGVIEVDFTKLVALERGLMRGDVIQSEFVPVGRGS